MLSMTRIAPRHSGEGNWKLNNLLCEEEVEFFARLDSFERSERKTNDSGEKTDAFAFYADRDRQGPIALKCARPPARARPYSQLPVLK